MRSYTNTLIFESVLDGIGAMSPAIAGVAATLFSPRVLVVEDNCDTGLGEVVAVSGKIEGKVELETDSPLSVARLTALALSGDTEVAIRSTSTCISLGGVCGKCLKASYPSISSPVIGNFYQIYPELEVESAVLDLPAGQTVLTLPFPAEKYDKLYVFEGGVITPSADYNVSGSTLTFTSSSGFARRFKFKFIVLSNLPYYYWLGKTYSGSLVGIKSVADLRLPLRESLLTAFINSDQIDSLYSALAASDQGGEDLVQYIPSIKGSLERAVYILFLSALLLGTS